MKIAVLDGQGAGLGQSIIKKIRQELPQNTSIIAIGTNTFATSKMVRAGANIGISGEQGFCAFCHRESIDGIIAPIGMIQPGSIHGEVTRRIAHTFSDLTCQKYLLPMHHKQVMIPCTGKIPIKELIQAVIEDLKQRNRESPC